MPLPGWELAASGVATCTSCGSWNQARIFSAAMRTATQVHAETALGGESTCYDHPGKRAVAACHQCGRFVCALCSVEFGSEVWCPSCVAGRIAGAQSANPETSRPLYDSVALMMPLLSLVMWPLTIITGPGSVIFSIMKWKAPLSLVRRTRWRFFVAILVGLAETAGWVVGVAYLLTRRSTGGG
ncbi:MAG: hypothetical protein DMG58_34510 [Acidobacteria bacterium]|nr:MAG: hypothetical protein DMG58_34510 [Acidobacteriota bacterium]